MSLAQAAASVKGSLKSVFPVVVPLLDIDSVHCQNAILGGKKGHRKVRDAGIRTLICDSFDEAAREQSANFVWH